MGRAALVGIAAAILIMVASGLVRRLGSERAADRTWLVGRIVFQLVLSAFLVVYAVWLISNGGWLSYVLAAMFLVIAAYEIAMSCGYAWLITRVPLDDDDLESVG